MSPPRSVQVSVHQDATSATGTSPTSRTWWRRNQQVQPAPDGHEKVDHPPLACYILPCTVQGHEGNCKSVDRRNHHPVGSPRVHHLSASSRSPTRCKPRTGNKEVQHRVDSWKRGNRWLDASASAEVLSGLPRTAKQAETTKRVSSLRGDTLKTERQIRQPDSSDGNHFVRHGTGQRRQQEQICPRLHLHKHTLHVDFRT